MQGNAWPMITNVQVVKSARRVAIMEPAVAVNAMPTVAKPAMDHHASAHAMPMLGLHQIVTLVGVLVEPAKRKK